MRSHFRFGALAAAGLICLMCLHACQRNDTPMPITQFVWEVMDLYYFWRDDMPNVNWRQYQGSQAPFQLLEALRHPLDRWSVLRSDGPEFLAFLQSGQMRGFGIAFRWAYDPIISDTLLHVAYTYESGPAGRAGIERGDVVLEINGTPIRGRQNISLTENTTFKIRKRDTQEIETHTLSREVIVANSILKADVIEINNTKVGYLCYNTFLSSDSSRLDQVFNELKNEGVQHMVLDLRYNGGGAVITALHLASLLAPSSAVGQTFVKQVWNSRNTRYNAEGKFRDLPARLNIDKLVVLTTPNTASASELIINGLKPFMDVKIVGDVTAGKNVGSAIFTHLNYAFLPIVFQSQNAEGSSDYYEGFQPDFAVEDDVRHDFGDPNEALLGAALQYLTTGSFPVPRRAPTRYQQTILEEAPNLSVMIGSLPD